MADLMREIWIVPTIILKWKKGRYREVFNPRSHSRVVLKANVEPRSEHGLLRHSKKTPSFFKYIRSP